MKNRPSSQRLLRDNYRQGFSGMTLIEVLVAVLVLSIGLLGMVGLQSRLQQSEMESYQRAQALLLLEDMANRISSNRKHADNYVTGTANPLGTGITCSTATDTTQLLDSSEWCNALQGAGETSGTSKVGAMVGGRGCVESLGTDALGATQYRISVAWQGFTPLSAPSSGVACGKSSYDLSGSNCTGDLCRRVITTTIAVANLL